MLTCRQVAEIAASETFATLPLLQRMGYRLHLLLCTCPHCGHFRKQLEGLRRLSRAHAARIEEFAEHGDAALPPAARESLRKVLQRP